MDIEKIRPALIYGRSQWRLDVRYDVEIEEAHRDARYDLVPTLSKYGRPVLDYRDRPLTLVAPLDRPWKIHHDVVTFRGRERFYIPRGSISNPRKLTLFAEVIRRGGRYVLDHKRTTVYLRRGFRPPYIDGRRYGCPPRRY